MNRRIITVSAVAAVLAVTLAGCHSSGGNAQEAKQQQADTTTLENNQPLPHFSYSQERQALIVAESAAAAGTQTTSFFFNQGVQNPVSSCPSIGMGVPDSASLSNPQQVYTRQGVAGFATIGQEDPDGIYVPESSSGTWVSCVDGQGREYLVRWEGFVYTVTGPATWDKAAGSVKLIGPPSMHINTRKSAN